jgi:hypothetical protein
MILIYAIFEKILFIYIGEERDKSIFCVPLTESWLTGYLSKFISNNCSIGRLQEDWEKYSALNLFRLKDYGTVEFRHMGGQKDPARISIWISLLIAMYNSAMAISTDELIEEIESLNTSSRFEEFKERVFGKKLANVLVVPDTKLIEQGVTFCKECISEAYSPLKVEASSALVVHLEALKKKENLLEGKKDIGDKPVFDYLVPNNKLWKAIPKPNKVHIDHIDFDVAAGGLGNVQQAPGIFGANPIGNGVNIPINKQVEEIDLQMIKQFVEQQKELLKQQMQMQKQVNLADIIIKKPDLNEEF